MENNINEQIECEEMPKKDNLEILRHSAAHIMAMAVKKYNPKTKLAIGPSIEDGFYYDFDDLKINEESLKSIEASMKKIIKENLPFKKEEISKKKAKEMFKDEPYKLELIKDLPGDKVSIYWTGKEFVDLCKGPHVKSTGEIKAVKLIKLAGAYWRGDEHNKMLTRIYGTAFNSRDDLDAYFKKLEEAEKRDHLKLGKQLDLFSIDPYIGSGLILWHPKLSVVREIIEEYWRHEHRKRGYEYVYTPHIGKAQLWETSGHLSFFKEGMYPPMSMKLKDKDEDTTYYAKPMSCPFHVRIYKSRPRTYKELPIRWCELGTVYRYERSGVLHGMLRVRGLTQDDAHIICTEDQFESEFEKVIDFAVSMNKVFGLNDLKFYLSVRDPKDSNYVGEKKTWEFAEKAIEKILKKRKVKYQVDVGGAKFYGPSLDLKAVDALGREWQGTTIQLDMNLPAKFGMEYVGSDGAKHVPIMLHRTLLGAMERFIGVLIEQYAGAFPTWLAPVQVKLISFTDRSIKYSEKIRDELANAGIRVECNFDSETVGKKVRDAELEKVPYIICLGDKEEEAKTLAVRTRGKGKPEFGVKLNDFIAKIKKEIENREIKP